MRRGEGQGGWGEGRGREGEERGGAGRVGARLKKKILHPFKLFILSTLSSHHLIGSSPSHWFLTANNGSAPPPRRKRE